MAGLEGETIQDDGPRVSNLFNSSLSEKFLIAAYAFAAVAVVSGVTGAICALATKNPLLSSPTMDAAALTALTTVSLSLMSNIAFGISSMFGTQPGPASLQQSTADAKMGIFCPSPRKGSFQAQPDESSPLCEGLKFCIYWAAEVTIA